MAYLETFSPSRFTNVFINHGQHVPASPLHASELQYLGNEGFIPA